MEVGEVNKTPCDSLSGNLLVGSSASKGQHDITDNITSPLSSISHATLSSASVKISEPVFTSNMETHLTDVSGSIITSLSNSELSVSGNIESAASIIITNDTIVFPPGTLMLSGDTDGENIQRADEIGEDLDDESGNENSEFDIKVESNALKSNLTTFKVESNQSDNTSSNFTMSHNVLQNISDPEGDLQQMSFSNGDHITQFHIQMPLSISDLQNLQKINRNVFMSQAALPEDNKGLDGDNMMVEQDGKHEYLTSAPSLENDVENKNVIVDNDSKEYLPPDGTFNADQHGNLFIKNENINTPGNVIQAEEIVEGNIKCENAIANPSENQLVTNIPYQQIMYVQVDATDPNGQPQLLPINVSESINENTLEIVSKPVDAHVNNHGEKRRKGRKPRVKKMNTDPIEKSGLRTLAPRLLSLPLYAGAQAGIGIGKSLLKPFNLGALQIVEGGQYFEVLGRCTQCFRFSRTTAYCRAEKNHREPKSSVCMECEAVGLSTVVCRRKLNHSAPNAQPLNIVINTALQNTEHVKQLCLRNNLPACFAELQSIVVHHADITFVGQRNKTDDREFGNSDLLSTPQVTRKPTDYARGYLYPYSKEKWAQWLLKFCYQTGTNFRIRTGKRVNKKLDHGLANHNGKIVPYRTLETQLYNCALGGRPRKRKIRDGIKKRKERGSKLIGCPAVIHTRLLETEYDWCALEVTIPKILAHLPFHDPRENPTSVLLVECEELPLSQTNVTHLPPHHVEEMADEEQKFDFIQEIGDENEDLNRKKECSVDLRKNTKSILLTCASLTEMIDNHGFMLSIQEQARDLLNKMHKEAINCKQSMSKKAKRKKYVAEQEGEIVVINKEEIVSNDSMQHIGMINMIN